MKHNAFFNPNTDLPNTTLSRSSTAFGRKIFRLSLIMMMFAAILSNHAAQAQKYVEQTLHNFQGKPTDGAICESTLINVNGTLYGTTLAGGANGWGTIFSVSATGSGFTTLYSFTTPNNNAANTDGAYPTSGLVNINGLLYGTTEYGGPYGEGAVFTFDPATNTEKAVYSFSGGTYDGAYPEASLTLVNGTLYGTTLLGGANGKGTVFSIDTFSSAEKMIYSFGASTADAANPYSSLIAVNGLLYGTTEYGGSLTYGTVFSIDPIAKTEHVLHTFTGTNTNNDGANPYASLTLVNGTLYGTTVSGGMGNYGTVFSLNTNGGGYLTLYSFTNSVGDGAYPYASLIYDSGSGKFFGTTYSGGFGHGTVFSWDPASQMETTLYRFTATDSSGHNADGTNPYVALLDINGTLYGTTLHSGTNIYGTVFSLTPTYPPTAVNHYVNVKYNTTLTDPAPGVLGGVNNGGSSPMTASLVANVTHGTLTLKSDGSFVYTPTKGFLGNDSFTYQASNAVGASNVATCTLMVKATPPIAVDHHVNVKRNGTLTDNAPGVLGGVDNGGSSPMTAALVTNVSHGTLSLKSDGSFVYTPTTGFAGTDSFTYQAVNSVGKSNIATCYLNVLATVPTAVDHHVNVKHNMTLTDAAPGVLGGVDNGGSSPITAALVTTVSHGTLSLKSDGSFVYTPTTGFLGTDSFTYQAINSVGKSNVATCYLNVLATAPIAVNHYVKLTHNTTLNDPAPGVLSGVDNGGSSPVTAALVANVTHGTLSLNSNGGFTYTPTTGFSGTDSFTYQAVNAVGKSNIATVYLTVQ